MTKRLRDMKIGEMGIITGYSETELQYRRKLLTMGLTRGTKVHLIKAAPLGDPLELEVRGYRLSLRRHEAAMLELQIESD